MADFVFIIHKGDIEAKSLILAASLRQKFGKVQRVHAAVPMINGEAWISEKAVEILKILEISVFAFSNPLIQSVNPCEKYILYANKIFVLDSLSNKHHLIFLDSDMICLEKFSIDSSLEKYLLLRAAGYMKIDNWKDIYDHFDLEMPTTKIKGILDGKHSFPYFNAGFIGLSTHVQEILVKDWKYYFMKLRKHPMVQSNLKNLDQITLSLAIQSSRIDYKLISTAFNYPLAYSYPVGNELPYLIHYHKPENILTDSRISNKFRMILKNFEEIIPVISNYPEWRKIIKRAL